MEARTNRLYYAELEEMILNIQDKIAELKGREKLCGYYEDKIVALTDLIMDLNALRR